MRGQLPHRCSTSSAALVFLPLVDLVAALCRRLLPDRPVADDPGKPRHLDPNVLDTPSEALGCAMRETLHIGDRVADMLRQALDVFEKSATARLVKDDRERRQRGRPAATRRSSSTSSRSRSTEMSEEESQRYVEILTFTTNLEHVGDIIDKNLMELAAKKIKNRYTFSRRGPGRDARLPCPRDGEPAAGLQRLHDARPRAGAPAGRREDGDARGRSARRRQPLRAPARGPAGIDRDQLDPSST